MTADAATGGGEQRGRLGERVWTYQGAISRRPLTMFVPLVIVFVVMCTIAGDHYDEESFRLAMWAVPVAAAGCAALCVRHTRIRLREHEHGFEFRRPGRRTLHRTWDEIASVESAKVSVRINFSHSHDVVRTVLRPYEGGPIRLRDLDYVKVRQESGFWRLATRGPVDNARPFTARASREVAGAVAVRHLEELAAGGEFRWGALTFTREGLTLKPFPGLLEWSRITFVSGGPDIGLRLDVRGLAGHVGAAALKPRATRAGYSTEGDRLKVFMPLRRPGSDYAALAAVLANGAALTDRRLQGPDQ
ncbi:hypothetical protein ACFU6R_14895 [Streptomyces sp. NPDC057499]|uniref:hypothetical protein n=1 Tax=Streptomyces sp. NPDC057499 TaxID=3346150 RepID=UPI00369AB1C2